jgi:hypothetical protein
MDIHDTAMARLSLLVQRILDADALCDAEAASLLTATEAARRSLAAGDTEAACQHVERVALFTETLVQTHLLDLADGRAVIETARHLLTEYTD